MMYSEELAHYAQMNAVAKKRGIVCVGTGLFERTPFCELMQSYAAAAPIYNRSFPALHIADAAAVLEQTAAQLCPAKLFLNLGEADLSEAQFDADVFIEQYRQLLHMLCRRFSAKLYVVAVISNNPAAVAVNQRLKALAADCGCVYVDAAGVLEQPMPDVALLQLLYWHMHSRPITFGEAMSL